ncbi:MAG: hypothetical protein BWY29_01072 [Microgenomates group bacterium ADurb.Bin238]|nr:MAG: hypothetical protein BWY29_01072 [Microgenomates group bacterium ADurb.Bin238]
MDNTLGYNHKSNYTDIGMTLALKLLSVLLSAYLQVHHNDPRILSPNSNWGQITLDTPL